MSSNSSDKIHKNLNPYFKSKTNPNWKALVEAIGESDNDTAELIQEVRKQFFIQTSSRPYIDRLAANIRVSRPPIVGMDDVTFRKYIPVFAYQPKQVKLVIDKMLDIFFFKEATTAFAATIAPAPYRLEDKWELSYLVDGSFLETIIFNQEDFTDINNAQVEEVVAAINRQAQFSFAIVFDDRIQKRKFVRIFTETIGSKGSVEIKGGRADIALQFLGIIENSGSTANTQWLISKIGDTITFQWTGGGSPNLNLIQSGDMVILDIPDNSGTFEIISVNLASNSFSFVNLFAVPGSFDHAILSNSFVRFLRLNKSIVWNRPNRATVWEVSPGEIVVEIPATPPVVRRELRGSAHINGMVELMTARPSDTSITIENASDWPTAGVIVFEPLESVDSHILTGLEDSNTFTEQQSRFEISRKHTYSGKLGNTLVGLVPELPRRAEIVENPSVGASRTANEASVITATPHKLVVGQIIKAADFSDASFDGTYEVAAIISPSIFKYFNIGPNTSASAGYVRSEFIGLSDAGSKIHLTTAQVNTGILGPYLWDAAASFILSSFTGKIVTDIKAGNIVLNLQIQTPNNIPDTQGFIIFDYGLETQEGPVRYLYKASDATIALDPSYVFKFDHSPTSSITAIRRRGAHVLSGLGIEYPFYVSDPSAARIVFQDLIKEVKSVGVFLRYIVRYPTNYYSTIDLYQSGIDPG